MESKILIAAIRQDFISETCASKYFKVNLQGPEKYRTE